MITFDNAAPLQSYLLWYPTRGSPLETMSNTASDPSCNKPFLAPTAKPGSLQVSRPFSCVGKLD